MERFLDGAILVTIDVVGLYLNVPQDEGLVALPRTQNKRSSPANPTDHIVDLAELALKNNNFEFGAIDFLYKNVVQPLIQGWRLAAYANLFMHNLVSQLLDLAKTLYLAQVH